MSFTIPMISGLIYYIYINSIELQKKNAFAKKKNEFFPLIFGIISSFFCFFRRINVCDNIFAHPQNGTFAQVKKLTHF